jgi:apolipoprotein N-acyltransferase
MDFLERNKGSAILTALFFLALAMYFGLVAVLKLAPQPIIPASLAGFGSFLGLLTARNSAALGDIKLTFLFGISLVTFTVTYWMTIQLIATLA